MGRTRLLWAAAAAAAITTAWASLSRPVEDRLSDLHVYLGAASAPSLYDYVRGDAPFTYPPFAAMLFRPLTAIPRPAVQFLWTTATILTVAIVAILTTRTPRSTTTTSPPPPPPPPPPRPRPSWGYVRPKAFVAPRAPAAWLALALTLSAPFSSNVRFGQISLFLAALIVTDLLVLTHTRASGVLIGLAAAIKLTPLIFIPLLFLAGPSPRHAPQPTPAPHRRRPSRPPPDAPHRRTIQPPPASAHHRSFRSPTASARRWFFRSPTASARRWHFRSPTGAAHRDAALRATVTFAACTAAGAITAPADSLRFWTSEIFHVSRLGHITSIGNQSLNGLLLRLDVPDDPRALITVAIGGTVAAAGLWRAARHARSGDWLTATVLTGAGSLVLSPVSWTHHQIWLVLAVLLPLRTPRAQATWTTVVLAVMLLPTATLDHPLWTNARLLLAVAIAAFLPLRTPAPERPDRAFEVIGAGHAEPADAEGASATRGGGGGGGGGPGGGGPPPPPPRTPARDVR